MSQDVIRLLHELILGRLPGRFVNLHCAKFRRSRKWIVKVSSKSLPLSIMFSNSCVTQATYNLWSSVMSLPSFTCPQNTQPTARSTNATREKQLTRGTANDNKTNKETKHNLNVLQRPSPSTPSNKTSHGRCHATVSCRRNTLCRL